MTSKIIETIPKFYVGELVRWKNAINTKYVKIAVIYKIETVDGDILFRYAGLKQQTDTRWEYLEKAMINLIFDENELYKLESHKYSRLILNNEHIKFEQFNPSSLCLDIITKPNSNNLFAINFKNTIGPKIKIKTICESIYSNSVTIISMMPGHRYNTDIQYCSHDTTFINLKKHNAKHSAWKEYTDVDTLEKTYVNHVHKLTSKEHPQTFLTNKLDDYVDSGFSPDNQYNWIKTFRKLICLLECKQCDHIIDIIKDCLIPQTKFCLGDIVYNNSYEGIDGLSSMFLEERNRTAKSLHFIVNDMYLIKDHNKLWKPRYLLITLEKDYKLGYCDEDTLGEVTQYKQIVYDKMNNLSKYKENDKQPINDIYDGVSNKKRKIMKVTSCQVTNTYKQYRSVIYNKKMDCKRIVEPLF
tara:strand:- start:436 stop:1674 length:1239 start_codon:yes stop_codon:yes gene_type:complete